ncbi:MAG: nucleoside-triphosphatase [Clostridia bacterium]
MHIFLTGAPGVGKTTVLSRTLLLLGARYEGFVTYFTAPRGAPEKMLFMGDAAEPRAPGAQNEVAGLDPAGAAPVPARFYAIGSALLARARVLGEVIVMDECGRLERDATAFQAEVLRCLNGDKPVLGVVRENAGGWTQCILSHPRVRLIYITPENRDALPGALCASLRASIAARAKSDTAVPDCAHAGY